MWRVAALVIVFGLLFWQSVSDSYLSVAPLGILDNLYWSLQRYQRQHCANPNRIGHHALYLGSVSKVLG